MNKTVLPPSLCALLFLAGCVFEPYRETARFDLTVVPTEAAPVRPVMVLELRNDSSSGLRIQSRAASGEVIGDPYNQWVLPPGELVSRALNLALLRDGAQNPLPLSGSIERFEVDRAEQLFRFSGFYAVAGTGKMRRFEIATPVTGDGAEQVASAASAAVAELARRIAADHFGDGKQQ